MAAYFQPTLPYFYYYCQKGKKMPELEFTHIPDYEELSVIFDQHIAALKAGTLTPKKLENLKDYCCLGWRLKGEIAQENHVKTFKFRDRLESIFRTTKPHKEVTPFKKKIEALVKETWG